MIYQITKYLNRLSLLIKEGRIVGLFRKPNCLLFAACFAWLLTAGITRCGAAEPAIKIGVILSTTGPAASLGIPEKNTIALLPRTMAGRVVEYIVVDDAGDTSNAVREMRRMVIDEKVDAVIGSTVTPSTIAVTQLAFESQTPIITLAAASVVIAPVDEKRRWIFKTPQNDSMMAGAILDHMGSAGIKNIAFIGFNDPLGQSWLSEITQQATTHGIDIAAVERFARTDTSVTAQVLKLLAVKPDAVFIAAYGTPALLPAKALKARGYDGKIYQGHGVANAEFLRAGGRDVEGTILPLGPMVVADQLPDSNPVKPVALRYVAEYEAKYGVGTASPFGGYAFDAGLLLAAALPVAIKAAEPGTAEFRVALRDALESTKDLVTTTGVMTMSPTDHLGLDRRARVMATIEDGKWKLLP
jgi:branched-chain amino acid transport system substrate-binding protein